MNYVNKDRILDLRNGRGWALIKRYVDNIDRTGKEWREAREAVRKLLKTGLFCALIGGNGRGKTQIAVDLMLGLSDDLVASEYTTAMGFFSDVKSAYGPSAPMTESEMLETYCRPRFLVIDEFEKRSDNAWANQLIFELLNRRYGMMRDTLIISNLDLARFQAFVGDALVSRMNEVGGVIECNWDSFR